MALAVAKESALAEGLLPLAMPEIGGWLGQARREALARL